MNSNKLKTYLSQLKTEGDHIEKFEDVIESMIYHHKAFYTAMNAGTETEEMKRKLDRCRISFSHRLTKLMLN